MDATSNFSLRFAQALGLKARLPERLLKRAALERIATGLSLISQAVGFSIIGILILATRHQAELNDSVGGGSAAIVGGTSALFVGTAFLIAAVLYWRFCANRSAGLAFSRKTVRLTFASPESATALASLAGDLLARMEKFMKIENQANGVRRAPLTFTVPACGFVVTARTEQFQIIERASEQLDFLGMRPRRSASEPKLIGNKV